MSEHLLSRARYKLPNTFCPPHNLKEYTQILQTAKDRGYRILRLTDLRDYIPKSSDKFMVLRHDIDTHPQAALRFAEAEERFGARGSYFFRLETAHPEVMRILHHRGHEVGYHYEELTAFAVSHHLKDKHLVLQQLPEIKQDFIRNLAILRTKLSLPLTAVAAHGDFTYSILDLGNKLFLQDADLRRELGIAYEAYDPELLAKYHNHVSDKPAPTGYYPESPLAFLQRDECLLFLSHPRWWIPNPLGNLASDLRVHLRRLNW